MDDRHQKNSLKLNVGVDIIKEGEVRENSELNGRISVGAKESYKSIPEDNLQINSSQKEKTSVDEKKMVQEADGADERVLENEKDEIRFIKGDHQNGDAKIDIVNVGQKVITGMSKDELMKYANDPFWVRIRWIFFILFWLAWAAMLFLAIYIVVDAPKCAAPTPLKWYQQGPLIHFKSVDAVDAKDTDIAKKVHATGVIYELPPEDTYGVNIPEIEEKIKKLVDTYKESDLKVILDITPNYVTRDSHFVKDALSDETKRNAFIWVEGMGVPNNWLSMVNGSAWAEIEPRNYILSQFGDGLYDLHMNDSLVKKELKKTFQHLLGLGIKGFRLKNTKFYLLTTDIRDEVPSDDPTYMHTQYGFWTHSQTTFQEGLGDLLNEYTTFVKATDPEAFLSINENTHRPEVYLNQIDLPFYGGFPHVLASPKGYNLFEELRSAIVPIKDGIWLQWNYVSEPNIHPSAYALFMSLLAGVPVLPAASNYTKLSATTLEHIDNLRHSASFMHGEFGVFKSGDVVAYSRIRSGNPGMFVVFNPTDSVVVANFTHPVLPDVMTIDTYSSNFDVPDTWPKGRVSQETESLHLSPKSTVIYSYVPIRVF